MSVDGSANVSGYLSFRITASGVKGQRSLAEPAEQVDPPVC